MPPLLRRAGAEPRKTITALDSTAQASSSANRQSTSMVSISLRPRTVMSVILGVQVSTSPGRTGRSPYA